MLWKDAWAGSHCQGTCGRVCSSSCWGFSDVESPRLWVCPHPFPISSWESSWEARGHRGDYWDLPDERSLQWLTDLTHSGSWAYHFGSLSLGFLKGYSGTREFWVNQMRWWIWKSIFVRSGLYVASRQKQNKATWLWSLWPDVTALTPTN